MCSESTNWCHIFTAAECDSICFTVISDLRLPLQALSGHPQDFYQCMTQLPGLELGSIYGLIDSFPPESKYRTILDCWWKQIQVITNEFLLMEIWWMKLAGRKILHTTSGWTCEDASIKTHAYTSFHQDTTCQIAYLLTSTKCCYVITMDICPQVGITKNCKSSLRVFALLFTVWIKPFREFPINQPKTLRNCQGRNRLTILTNGLLCLCAIGAWAHLTLLRAPNGEGSHPFSKLGLPFAIALSLRHTAAIGVSSSIKYSLDLLWWMRPGDEWMSAFRSNHWVIKRREKHPWSTC